MVASHTCIFEIACLGDGVLPCVEKDAGCAQTKQCTGCLLCRAIEHIEARKRTTPSVGAFATYHPSTPRFGDDVPDGAIVEILDIDDGGTFQIVEASTGRVAFVQPSELELL